MGVHEIMFGTQWYMRLGNWGFNLVLLNLLWLLFSFSGLLVVGIFPATAALFAVMRLMIMESDNGSMIKLFWAKFKSEFVAANVVGYVMLLIGLVLYTDLKVLHYVNQDTLYTILMSTTIVVIFIYVLSLLYIFSVFVHYDLKIWQYPKHAFILVIARPLHTLIMAILVVSILFLYLQLPVLIVLFGISLISYVLMKFSYLSFSKESV